MNSLDCSDNQLTNIDLSKNINLEWLACTSNNITTLYLTNNTELWFLACDKEVSAVGYTGKRYESVVKD